MSITDTLVNDATKDIVARMDKLKADLNALSPVEPTPTPEPPTPEPTPIPPPTPTGNLDKFGIKKIYSDSTANPNGWYVNMEDPAQTTNFKNLPQITKQPDGSFQTSSSQVRMEAWSPTNKKWLNVEITCYTKLVSGSPTYLVQLYSRGGHHFSDQAKWCEGSAYKGALQLDGNSTCRKEVNHPAYCSNKGTVRATTTPLTKRWVGYKTIIYNFVSTGGKTFVHIENYIDDEVNDSNGNLVIKNNWKKCATTDDIGGWSTSNSDFKADCPHLNKDMTTGYRTRDEILNTSGGTATQNLAAWRTDGATNNWKYLSVREIQV